MQLAQKLVSVGMHVEQAKAIARAIEGEKQISEPAPLIAPENPFMALQFLPVDGSAALIDVVHAYNGLLATMQAL